MADHVDALYHLLPVGGVVEVPRPHLAVEAGRQAGRAATGGHDRHIGEGGDGPEDVAAEEARRPGDKHGGGHVVASPRPGWVTARW